MGADTPGVDVTAENEERDNEGRGSAWALWLRLLLLPELLVLPVHRAFRRSRCSSSRSGPALGRASAAPAASGRASVPPLRRVGHPHRDGAPPRSSSSDSRTSQQTAAPLSSRRTPPARAGRRSPRPLPRRRRRPAPRRRPDAVERVEYDR